VDEEINQTVKDIIDFGYEYGLFSEKEDYSELLEKVRNKILNINFLQDLENVIYDKIRLNLSYIKKNKKLNNLKMNVDNLKRKIELEK